MAPKDRTPAQASSQRRSARSGKRAVIYARISVSLEASVSIDRQLEAATAYAAARGWEIVGTFTDDGVSASKNKPEQRAGWKALLAAPEPFDVVIVWKVDRLARRVIDFLLAHQTLTERGAAVVAVDDPIDMSTAQGRGFATMLAVFAEMEADAISARVKAARSHLLRSGRVVGGTVPYGWRSVPNADGAGYRHEHDPDRIGYVREMVKRFNRGATVYSIQQWLNEIGAPTPLGKTGCWSYSSVERILRHPILAGLTPYNPGNASKTRGQEYLRKPNGLPVVDRSVSIMTVTEWRKMTRALDNRDTAQSRPRALRTETSPLLSGLVWCGEHGESPVRMHRGTINGRHGYYCPTCHQSISNLEPVVVERFKWAKGDRVRWSVFEEVTEGGDELLPEISHRMDELWADLKDERNDEKAERLNAQILELLAMRNEALESAPVVTFREVGTAETYGEAWAAASSVEEQRAVLDDALTRVTVRRGAVGRSTPAKVLARITFEWKMPEDFGPVEIPDDETLASWAG